MAAISLLSEFFCLTLLKCVSAVSIHDITGIGCITYPLSVDLVKVLLVLLIYVVNAYN